MDYFQRNWKPGDPNTKYPGGIPCHRHKTLEDELESRQIGKNKTPLKERGGTAGAPTCSICNKRKTVVTKHPASLQSSSLCGICNREYPEVTKAIHGTNECRTRKITKPIGSGASLGSSENRIKRNGTICPACPAPPEPTKSSSSCGICSHAECKKPLREDLALILSVLDKNKGCNCGTVARALRTGVHSYMRIGQRFSENPLPSDLETIGSDVGIERKDDNGSTIVIHDPDSKAIPKISPKSSIAKEAEDKKFNGASKEKINDAL